MTTSDMIRALCEKQNISLAELCRRIGRHRRILIRSYNVARSFEKMMKIVEALDVGYEQAFVFPDGSEITIGIK